MHAIDSPGSINSRFSEGNPATGQRASRVGADWLNDTQENLLAVLGEAGLLPTKARAADLVDAIKVIVRAAGGGSGGSVGAVPNTRKITGAGLLADQGGDLSSDRTLTLLRASPSEINTGTEDGKVVTPKGLFDAISGSSGGGSVQIGPFIIKAGATVGAYSGDASVYTPFPVAFPNECWGAFPTARTMPQTGTRTSSRSW